MHTPGRPHRPSASSAYIGLVEETGSLFALSPAHFPLVVFGSKERELLPASAHQGRTIGESHDTDDEKDEFQFCLRNRYTPRCLVGVRKLSDGEADPTVGPWTPLIDAPKTHAPALQQPMDNGAAVPHGEGPPPARRTRGRVLEHRRRRQREWHWDRAGCW